MSRWVPLVATSPSGKTLFVCRMCGRQSPTPDRECKESPANVLGTPGSCMLLEEVFAAAHIMESGQHPVSYQILGETMFVLHWLDAEGNNKRAYLHVVDGDLKDLWEAIANGKATEQRAGALAEPASETD